MAGKNQAHHTWIIMNHRILKSYHMYFHWYNVPNLRNENVHAWILWHTWFPADKYIMINEIMITEREDEIDHKSLIFRVCIGPVF